MPLRSSSSSLSEELDEIEESEETDSSVLEPLHAGETDSVIVLLREEISLTSSSVITFFRLPRLLGTFLFSHE